MDMIDKPSPRLDALRAMREATYERGRASHREMARASDALAKRKEENIMRDLQDQATKAVARSDEVAKRRKAKKAAKNSRRGQ